MNEALRLILILIFGNIFLVAFFAVLGALFPRRIARTRAVADAMPGRAFLVGLINFAFFAALGLALSALTDSVKNPLPRIPAALCLALLSLGVSFGLAGVVQLVGERLRPQATGAARTVWGAFTLSLACTLPFVGWFGLLPYTGLLGLGAFIISFFQREKPAPPAVT